MKWKYMIRVGGKPHLYESFEKGKKVFSLQIVGSAIYLVDLRKDKIPYPIIVFDTVENAKIAAKEAMKGKKLKSNCKDPFEGLSELIKDAEEFLNSLKKK